MWGIPDSAVSDVGPGVDIRYPGRVGPAVIRFPIREGWTKLRRDKLRRAASSHLLFNLVQSIHVSKLMSFKLL